MQRVSRNEFDSSCGRPVIVQGVFPEVNHLARHIRARAEHLVGANVVDCDVVDQWGNFGLLNVPTTPGSEFFAKITQKRLYLKDWHLALDEGDFYEVPDCFEDWMDSYQRTERNDDFRFVYYGSAGSWTPVHVDVLATFSWSVNIVGSKEWVFWEPGRIKNVDNYNARLNYFETPESFPAPTLVFTQATLGDAIFVPSGWAHCVRNLETTISINQNWGNENNLTNLCDVLLDGMKDVEHEIQHLKHGMSELEWLETTRRLLRANLGMNFEDLRVYLRYAPERCSELVQSVLERIRERSGNET